MTFFAPTEF